MTLSEWVEAFAVAFVLVILNCAAIVAYLNWRAG